MLRSSFSEFGMRNSVPQHGLWRVKDPSLRSSSLPCVASTPCGVCVGPGAKPPARKAGRNRRHEKPASNCGFGEGRCETERPGPAEVGVESTLVAATGNSSSGVCRINALRWLHCYALPVCGLWEGEHTADTVSRLARTQPALPAPTMMKSNVSNICTWFPLYLYSSIITPNC